MSTSIYRFALALAFALTSASAQVLAQDAPAFNKEQLDQMVAPIALYPDSLLSQVLMAATYPADVAEAAAWSKANPKQSGDDAVKAVDAKPWDPSVKSLVAFPQVLHMMGDKPDWVQNLGDAFLASSKDVLDSAQRLRAQAKKAGNLESNAQQNVVVEQVPAQSPTPSTTQVIVIEPANPQVVYVPAYNPTVVYGAWPYPAYPPYYMVPPPVYYPGTVLASGIAFGVGVGIASSLWGDANWGGGDVDIDVEKYNNVNVNNKIEGSKKKFGHNAENRRGAPYRDQTSRERYGKNVPGAEQREDYRGRDASRDAQRQRAQASLQERGMDPAASRDQLRNDPQTRERAQNATRDSDRNLGGNADRAGGSDRDIGGSNNNFGGSDHALRDSSNGRQARQQMDRGSASRASMSVASRGGGGGARGGGGRR